MKKEFSDGELRFLIERLELDKDKEVKGTLVYRILVKLYIELLGKHYN